MARTKCKGVDGVERLMYDAMFGTVGDKMKAASANSLPLEVEEILADDDDCSVRRRLADNEGIHEETARKLSCDKDFEVRKRLASNKGTPVSVLHEMLFRFNTKGAGAHHVAMMVLKNPSLPESEFFDFYKKCDAGGYFVLASCHSCPGIILEDIYSKEDIYFNESLNDLRKLVNVRIAGNPNTPLGVIKAIMQRGDIRGSLVVNPSVPSEMLEELYESTFDPSIFFNPSCPTSVLEKGLSSREQHVRREAVMHRNVTCRRLKELLSKEKSRRVLQAMLANPNCDEELLTMIRDKFPGSTPSRWAERILVKSAREREKKEKREARERERKEKREARERERKEKREAREREKMRMG